MKKLAKPRLISLGRVSATTRAVLIGPRKELGSETLHTYF